jgi:hypothetical protein
MAPGARRGGKTSLYIKHIFPASPGRIFFSRRGKFTRRPHTRRDIRSSGKVLTSAPSGGPPFSFRSSRFQAQLRSLETRPDRGTTATPPEFQARQDIVEKFAEPRRVLAMQDGGRTKNFWPIFIFPDPANRTSPSFYGRGNKLESFFGRSTSFPSSAWERPSPKLCFGGLTRSLARVVASTIRRARSERLAVRSGASRKCGPKQSLGPRGNHRPRSRASPLEYALPRSAA